MPPLNPQNSNIPTPPMSPVSSIASPSFISRLWPWGWGVVTIGIIGSLLGWYVVLNNFNPDNISGSNRFKDNHDNSIKDLVTGYTWMKCNYGEEGNNCKEGQTSSPSVGYNVGFGKCYTWNSGKNTCENGVLCKDGSFQKVDVSMDFRRHPDDYPAAAEATLNSLDRCFFVAPDVAKDRACERYGGVSKYNWEVPSSEQIATLYDKNQEKNIDRNFFPTTPFSTYLVSDVNSTSEGRQLVHYSYNFSNNRTQIDDIAAGTLKCILKDSKEVATTSFGLSDSFCNSNYPYMFYIEAKSEYLTKGTDNNWIKTNFLTEAWTYRLNSKETLIYMEETNMNDGKMDKWWYKVVSSQNSEELQGYSYLINPDDGKCRYASELAHVFQTNSVRYDIGETVGSIFNFNEFVWFEKNNWIYQNNYILGKDTLFNNYEVYSMKPTEELINNKEESESTQTIDYFNKLLCGPMKESNVFTSGRLKGWTEDVAITKIKSITIDENIVTPPKNCERVSDIFSLRGEEN